MPRRAQFPPLLIELISRQDDVVTASQLIDAGLGRSLADKRVAAGRWQRLLPGVFLAAPQPATVRQRLIAAWLWAGPAAAIDGPDACRWYGVPLPMRGPGCVHLVVPWAAQVRSRDFVVVRRTLSEIEVGERGVVPYVDLPTAVIVAARNCHSTGEAIGLLSTALQTGAVDQNALALARERIGDKWCQRVDEALLAVGIGARSPAESDTIRLVRTSEILPEPLWNQWLDLGDGGPPVCADGLLVDAGLVLEINSRRYHELGNEFEGTEARHARVTASGLVVQRCTPVQVRRDGIVFLRRMEATYLHHAGRGLPAGVRLIAAPAIATWRP